LRYGQWLPRGDETINLAKKISASHVFQNSQGSANGAVIDAVFTDESEPLQISGDSGGMTALGLIESDLSALQVSGGSLTGTIP